MGSRSAGAAALLAVQVAAATFSPGPATAQVFKCGKAGAMVFSDKPCPGSDAAPLRMAGAGANGSLDFQVGTRHYQVRGATIQAARASIRANGPEGWAGFARWDVKYSYESKPAGSNCAVSSVAIKVTGDIQMPEWVDMSSASQADQAAWQAMYNNLKRHEDGHVQHGREFGALLKERLLGLGAVPCDELATRTRNEMNQLHGNLSRRDREYDQRTDHGLRQDNPR